MKQQPDICQLDLLFVRFDLGDSHGCNSGTSPPSSLSDYITIDGQPFCGSLQPSNRSQYFAPPAAQPFKMRTFRFDKPQLEIYFEGRLGTGYGYQLRGKQVTCAGLTVPYHAQLEEITDRPQRVHLSPGRTSLQSANNGEMNEPSYQEMARDRGDARRPTMDSTSPYQSSFSDIRPLNRIPGVFVISENEQRFERPNVPISNGNLVTLSQPEREAFGRQSPVLVEAVKPDSGYRVDPMGENGYTGRKNYSNQNGLGTGNGFNGHTSISSRHSGGRALNDHPDSNQRTNYMITNTNDTFTRGTGSYKISAHNMSPTSYSSKLPSSSMPIASSRFKPNLPSSVNNEHNHHPSHHQHQHLPHYGSVSWSGQSPNHNQSIHLRLNQPEVLNGTNVHVYIPAPTHPSRVDLSSTKPILPSIAANNTPPHFRPQFTQHLRNESNQFNITNYQLVGWGSRQLNPSAGQQPRSFGLGAHGAAGGYCDQMLDVSTFQLKSPNHPNAYPSQLFCTYVIRRQSVQICALELTFLAFHLPEQNDCNGTYLDIDGGRICGPLPPYHQRE